MYSQVYILMINLSLTTGHSSVVTSAATLTKECPRGDGGGEHKAPGQQRGVWVTEVLVKWRLGHQCSAERVGVNVAAGHHRGHLCRRLQASET